MRLVIDGQILEALSIIRTGDGSEFAVHTEEGLTGTHLLVKEQVLGDALRARFDFLERRMECGDLEYVAVKDEMRQIATILIREKI